MTSDYQYQWHQMRCHFCDIGRLLRMCARARILLVKWEGSRLRVTKQKLFSKMMIFFSWTKKTLVWTIQAMNGARNSLQIVKWTVSVVNWKENVPKLNAVGHSMASENQIACNHVNLVLLIKDENKHWHKH